MLNTHQADQLRYLCRQSGPVLLDHLDGRIIRALENRGLVEVRGGWVSPTPAGRALRDQPQRAPARRAGRRSAPVNASGARALSILKAVDELERAIPIDAEIDLPEFRTYADDILTGLRQYARQMERGRPGE